MNLSQASISKWILACMSKTQMTMSELLIDFDSPFKTQEDKQKEVDEKAKRSADIYRIWLMKEYERQKANGEEKR